MWGGGGGGGHSSRPSSPPAPPPAATVVVVFIVVVDVVVVALPDDDDILASRAIVVDVDDNMMMYGFSTCGGVVGGWRGSLGESDYSCLCTTRLRFYTMQQTRGIIVASDPRPTSAFFGSHFFGFGTAPVGTNFCSGAGEVHRCRRLLVACTMC